MRQLLRVNKQLWICAGLLPLETRKINKWQEGKANSRAHSCVLRAGQREGKRAWHISMTSRGKKTLQAMLWTAGEA